MEEQPKVGQIWDRSKLTFLGGVASLGEGLATIGEGIASTFGLNQDQQRTLRISQDRGRRYYSVKEDPYGHKEDSAALRNGRQK